jgi:hypothetical protein
MTILVSIVLAVLALAFVLYPLARRFPTNNRGDAPGGDGGGMDRGGRGGLQQSAYPDRAISAPTSPDAEREQGARDALREVELDFQLGNIAEQDYRRLRERYMQRALVALKSRYDREQELDELIEAQLRKLKEQGHDAIQ